MGSKKKYLYLIVAGLAVSITISGCGESKNSAEPVDETTIAVAATPVPGETLTAADLPAGVGTRLVFAANTPGKPVDVSFRLEGPWTFSSGPSSMTLNMTTVATQASFSADDFPDADFAVMSSWSPGAERVEYNFQDIDESAWRAYGKSAEKSRILTYSTPSRALILPAAVGDRWVDSYNEIEGDKTVEITSENHVVAQNTLTVPAGDFNAFLLQTKVSAKSNGVTNVTWDYTWFVPGIGRAAEIISEPNETREAFTKARVFYRLKSFSVS